MADTNKTRNASPPDKSNLSNATASFPQHIEEFKDDKRVTYSAKRAKWTLKTDDDSTFEWDEQASTWAPSLDEDLVQRQQQAYTGSNAAGDEAAGERSALEPSKKRKNREEHSNGSSKPARKNCAIYVTRIPLDADSDEVHRLFSRYGMIAEEIDSGNPRIKLYTDEKGDFKGDALIVYFRPESVSIAIDMLDESDFRPGQPVADGPMRVTEADQSYKRQKQPVAENDSAKAEKPKRSGDQAKIIERTKKLNAKLADWSDEDDDPSAMPQTSSRHDKVVILKHMFTLEELAEDPQSLLDIKTDVEEECAKLGPVTRTILFDKESDGYMSVRFGNAIAANECVKLMNGRHFDGRVVEARISTGKERFKKTKKTDGDDDEDENLESFSNWVDNTRDA